jgi:hypothetical protein
VAAGYHQLAYYGRAADYYEAFATKFPGEPQAMTALANATAFREGLGDGKAALADMDAYISFFGARNPQAAASVYFQKAEVFEAERKYDELAAHLQRYLGNWARPGGSEQQVQAHFRLGELAWKASCPRATDDGACVHIDRLAASRGRQLMIGASRKLGRSKRTQCGPPTRSRIAALERSRRPATDADQHFRKALALWKASEVSTPTKATMPAEGNGRVDERKTNASYAAAGAAFYLAEKEYENLLRLRFPENLDLSRQNSESQRRLAAFLAEKTRLLEIARAQYLEVFRMRQAHWTIAAAARIAQLHQDFAAQLYTAEIPRNLPEVDRWGNRPRDLYCDALEDQADRVEAKAVDGFKTCLAAATQQGWFNEWSRLCERELNQLEPIQFPLSSEAKPEAGYLPISLSAVPVITSLGN